MLFTIPELLELLYALPANSETVLNFYVTMANDFPSESDWLIYARRIYDPFSRNQYFVLSHYGIGFLELFQDDKCELFIEEEFEPISLTQLIKISERNNWGEFVYIADSFVWEVLEKMLPSSNREEVGKPTILLLLKEYLASSS